MANGKLGEVKTAIYVNVLLVAEVASSISCTLTGSLFLAKQVIMGQQMEKAATGQLRDARQTFD